MAHNPIASEHDFYLITTRHLFDFPMLDQRQANLEKYHLVAIYLVGNTSPKMFSTEMTAQTFEDTRYDSLVEYTDLHYPKI